MTMTAASPASAVGALFASIAGSRVALLPNSGNCGDGLIYMGFRALCRRFSVSATEILAPRPARGRTLLVLGCGNLCGPFHFLLPHIIRYQEMFDRVVVLPCSADPGCDPVGRWLRELPSHVTVLFREKASLELAVAATGRDTGWGLDDDLAVHVDYSPWMSDAGKGTLNAFRTDRESRGWKLPPGNLDISLWGSATDGHVLPETITRYRVVRTDRAHVALCATLMGKETHVFPNGYHKVRGIFEQTLSRYPNARFHEGPP